MSNDDPQRRSVGARLSPDLNEYVADWFLTPSSRSDVVDVVLEPPCQCGSCLGEIFRTTRYGRVFGPVYWGEVTLASYAGWERLVAGGRASREEREILIA
ncbi:hypothetical protein SNE32_17335, partial [Lysobacter sp. D1-1-M9]|uniref:hypothetical protein n=1 Tax=Novilysobacter longmucuonensis TaxID=3098603 RepID=UPI002FC83D59